MISETGAASAQRRELFRYQQVEHYILQLVEHGTLTAGDKLPSLRALSRQLHLSVSTISQAYIELERQGLIVARSRSGFYLASAGRQLPQPQGVAALDLQPRRCQRNQLIREVLDTVGQRDLLPLGVICPDDSLLPSKTLARLLNSQQRRHGVDSILYASINGELSLRQQIAQRCLEMGITVAPDEVIITSGAMEAVYLALRSLTRPGDNVVIASPTYHCFLQLLENCGLRAIELPSDPQRGICPQQLEKVLLTHEVRACILAANFNNPDGSLLADEHKQQVVDLLARHQVPLVEDDVSGDLYFGDQRPSTLKGYDRGGNVMYCNSFSKTIAPGYRIGWLLPGRYYDKALEVKYTTNVCCATPTQQALAAYLNGGYYSRQLRRLRQALETQMRTMQLHLGRQFPAGTRVTRPQGGGVLWLELPNGLNAVDYFYQARRLGIGIAPGPIFTTQDRYSHFIRLSCSGVWTPRLEQGLSALSRLAHTMLDSAATAMTEEPMS